MPWEEKAKTAGLPELIALNDELEKIGTASKVALHMQARKGRTPIRVSTLLAKERVYGGGVEGVLKKASLADTRDAALDAFAEARPYASSAAKGAVPGALLGGILGSSKGKHGYNLAKGFAAAGGAAGILDHATKRWAEKHKRKRVAKKILAGRAA